MKGSLTYKCHICGRETTDEPIGDVNVCSTCVELNKEILDEAVLFMQEKHKERQKVRVQRFVDYCKLWGCKIESVDGSLKITVPKSSNPMVILFGYYDNLDADLRHEFYLDFVDVKTKWQGLSITWLDIEYKAETGE